MDTRHLLNLAYKDSEVKRVVIIDDNSGLETDEYVNFAGVWIKVTELILPNQAIVPEYITLSELHERVRHAQ